MRQSANRTTPPAILLIEDTPSLQLIYRTVLQGAGHQVRVANSATEGMAAFVEAAAAVVLLDLGLPDRNGLEMIHEMLTLRPGTRIIVITANGSINKAVEAMRAGAHEFLVKPFDEGRFLTAVRNALTGPLPARPSSSTATTPTAPVNAPRPFLGSSDAMERIHSKIASVANSMATVFVTGESGTGKELCALAVHGTSARAKGPFIALN